MYLLESSKQLYVWNHLIPTWIGGYLNLTGYHQVSHRLSWEWWIGCVITCLRKHWTHQHKLSKDANLIFMSSRKLIFMAPMFRVSMFFWGRRLSVLACKARHWAQRHHLQQFDDFLWQWWQLADRPAVDWSAGEQAKWTMGTCGDINKKQRETRYNLIQHDLYING